MRKIFTKIYSTYKVRVHSFNIVKIFHIVRVGTYIRNLHSLIFKQFLCTAFYVYAKQVLKPYTSAGILITYLQVYCTYYIGFRLIIRLFAYNQKSTEVTSYHWLIPSQEYWSYTTCEWYCSKVNKFHIYGAQPIYIWQSRLSSLASWIR